MTCFHVSLLPRPAQPSRTFRSSLETDEDPAASRSIKRYLSDFPWIKSTLEILIFIELSPFRMSNGLRYETSVFFKPEENLSENFIIKFRWHCFHPSTSKHQSIVCQRRRNIVFSPPLQSRPRKMRRSYEWKFFYDSQERENEKTESYATCVKGTRRKKRQIIIIQHNTNKFSAIKTKRELSRFSEKGRKFSIPKKKRKPTTEKAKEFSYFLRYQN